MCGIVGYCGYQNAKNIVLDGLHTLEYRGYDSAGIAINTGDIHLYKSVGRVSQLEQVVPNIIAHVGIGHTRWATHGEPSHVNSHPHLSYDGQVAIVHNGVIENCEKLREYLLSKNITFTSQTDSEIIAHLLALKLQDYDDCCQTSRVISCVQEVGNMIEGSATFLATIKGDNHIYLFKRGASLSIGISDGENFVASDTLAISKHTQRIITLNDNESAVLNNDGVTFYKDAKKIIKRPTLIKRSAPKECSCYMRAEIDEIPTALINTYNLISIDDQMRNAIKCSKKIYFVGCGTAYHAGLYGKEIFETLLNVPCECIVASEADNLKFLDENSVVIAITQSGETADTLNALEYCKNNDAYTIAITNVEGSAISFVAHKTLYLGAGAEVAVAATKSYNCQLLSLYLIANQVANRDINIDFIDKLCALCDDFPVLYEDRIKKSNLFFVGKGLDTITAKEGALKFKEITYKMTDAYSAGELKHGAIALIDTQSVVIAIATNAYDKHRIEATISELRSRGAYVIAITSIGDIGANKTLQLPFIIDELAYPIISIIPLQNLALTASLCLGLNPDKPRNLAKSVTVI